RPGREIDQWQWHGERNQYRPGDRHQSVVAAGVRDDAKNFARGFLLGHPDGLGNTPLVAVRDHRVTNCPRRHRIVETIHAAEEKTARRTGTAERAAPAGEATAPPEAPAPERTRRSPQTRDLVEDRSARPSSRAGAGSRVYTA